MNLAETQDAFGAWLQGGPAPRFGKCARPGLRVYRNTYRAQLVACLQESFPHTFSWIGGEAFHAAIVAHVVRVPPSSWTLDAYARDFPDTLGQLYPADPEVAELAALERALGDAFVGADAAPVPAAMLTQVDWDRAVLHLTPTLELVDATTNAAAIWQALAMGEAPPSAEVLPGPAALLIWRQAMDSQFRIIDAAERQAILLAGAGTSFGALCLTLVAVHGETDGVALAGRYLGRWLADELVIDITGDEPCVPLRP